MRGGRHTGQDGFIREVVWLVVIVGVIAVVLLDALALFNTHQTSHDAAASAVREAQTEYAQSLSVAQAKLAAQDYLRKSGARLVSLETTGLVEGSMGFAVTATARAKTYAFRYLGKVPGLEDWVDGVVNPVSTESSD